MFCFAHVVQANPINASEDAAEEDPVNAEALMREGKTLQSLNHPNIAQLYNLQKVGNIALLNMEFCPGGDLHVRC